MDRITRYIFSQLGLGLVLVTAGLTTIIWLTQSLRFVKSIINKGLSTGDFLYLTTLLLPDFLIIILPVALFATVLFIFTRLISDREMVVMTVAGLSPLRLGRAAIIMALLVAAIIYALNLYITPYTFHKFKIVQRDLRYNYSQILLQEGVFNVVSKGVSVYIRERTRNGDLRGILVHDARDPNKPSTLIADGGALIFTESGPSVVMYNGNRQVVDKEKGTFSILYFDRYGFNLEKTTKTWRQRKQQPRELMLGELFEYAENEELKPRERGKYLVEAHHRLISPMHAILYTLISLICLFSGDATRRGQTRRIFAAVGLTVAHVGLHMGLLNVVPGQPSMVVLIYLSTFVPMAIAFVILTHGRLSFSLKTIRKPLEVG